VVANPANWKTVERRTVRMLSKHLQADLAGGGSKCVLGGYQIDAYGIFGRVALVFECKTTRHRRLNINDAIDKLAGSRSAIRRDLRRRHGKRLKHFRFVVLVGRADQISRYDRRRRKPRDVSVWTPKYFEAVEQLSKTIKRRALPYVLKELGFANLGRLLLGRRRAVAIPSLRVKLGRGKRSPVLHAFFVPARILLDLGYVARLESSNPRAYQRLLSRSRVKDIADYINAGGGFKNSVVLSLPKRARFKSKWSQPGGRLPSGIQVGILTIPYEPASLWIIDGQHRIYGYANARPKRLDSALPAVGVRVPSALEQGKIFVDINKNQKPVDSNLLWDLYYQLMPDSATGLVSELVHNLNSRGSSPLHEKIYIPGSGNKPRTGYRIYMVNVCDGIVRQGIFQLSIGHKSRTPLEDIPLGRLQRASKRTYRNFTALYKALRVLCEDVGQKSWWGRFFLSNNGISVVTRLFRELLVYGKVRFRRSELIAFLRPSLASYFEQMEGSLDALLRNTSSEGGRESAATDILGLLNRQHEDFAREKLREARKVTREDAFYRALRNFEKSMRGIIREQLEKRTPRWWGERIPQVVRDRAEETWRRASGEGSRLDRLEMSDYMRIISYNWGDCFSGCYGPFKRDKNWLSMKLQELTALRNKYFHFHGALEPSEQDTWHARILVSQILEPFGGARTGPTW
jgi:DNA sulfur modification protein DndB